jgi:hypothetical protein
MRYIILFASLLLIIVCLHQFINASTAHPRAEEGRCDSHISGLVRIEYLEEEKKYVAVVVEYFNDTTGLFDPYGKPRPEVEMQKAIPCYYPHVVGRENIARAKRFSDTCELVSTVLRYNDSLVHQVDSVIASRGKL